MGNQGSAEQQAALLSGVDETLAVLAGRTGSSSSAGLVSATGSSGVAIAGKKISFTFNLPKGDPTSPRSRKSTAAENSQTLPAPIPPSASRDSITAGSTSPRQVKFSADDSQKPSSPDSNPALSNAPAGFRSRFGSRRLASINITDIEAVRNKLAELTATMDIGQQVEMITGMEHRTAPAQPTEVDLIGDSDDDEDVEADSAAASESGDGDEDKDQPNTSREPSSSDADPAGPIDRSQMDRRQSRRGGVFKQEDEKEVHRKEKKALVIQEIQASEHLYYKFLDIMINHYIKPLRERRILNEAQISSIFSNIEVIAPYHKVIAQELEKEDAAEVYRRYASYLKVYTNYVTNYDKACDVVAALKSNQQFRQFLAEKRKDPVCGGLDLMSFLIMPIQRIPRYPLLLSELKKYTSETDAETSVLDDALEKVSFIANYVNEAKRMAINRARILEIQNTVSGDFENLLQPGRFLVHDAMIYEKKKRSTKAHLYCFNDLLLWTNDSHNLSGMVNLATASVSEYKHKTKQGFVISSPALDDGKVIFRCNTLAEKKLWMKHISECLKAQQSTLLRSRDVRRQRSHVPPPSAAT